MFIVRNARPRNTQKLSRIKSSHLSREEKNETQLKIRDPPEETGSELDPYELARDLFDGSCESITDCLNVGECCSQYGFCGIGEEW
jgi:hypothetical protein